MFCYKCGQDLADDAKFCPVCGSAQGAQANAQPQGGQAYAQPQAGQAYAQPQGGQAYAQPQAGQAYAQPQAGQPYAQPQAGQPYAQPQGGQAYAQPQAGQAYAQPQGGQAYAQPQAGQPYAQPQAQAAAPDLGAALKKEYQAFSAYVGDTGIVKLKFSDLVSDIFKTHTREEKNEIMLHGIAHTETASDLASWKKPWLYSRFLAILVLTYLVLYVGAGMFDNTNFLPGLIIVGAFAMPFSLLIFFWEMDLPASYSFLDVLLIFFLGGTLSLISAIIFGSVLYGDVTDPYLQAVITGIVEEGGKIVITFIFIRRFRCRYLLDGLLIGAAVGAGFAAFESAGYAMNYGLLAHAYSMEAAVKGINDVTILRGFLAGGGHIAWAAVTCGAMVMTSPDNCASASMLKSGKCWVLFAIPTALHAVWDMPIEFLTEIYFVQLALTAIIWVLLLIMLRTGFAEYFAEKAARLQAEAAQAEAEGGEAPAAQAEAVQQTVGTPS